MRALARSVRLDGGCGSEFAPPPLRLPLSVDSVHDRQSPGHTGVAGRGELSRRLVRRADHCSRRQLSLPLSESQHETVSIEFTDAARQSHTATGPELDRGQEGTLLIEIKPGQSGRLVSGSDRPGIADFTVLHFSTKGAQIDGDTGSHFPSGISRYAVPA